MFKFKNKKNIIPKRVVVFGSSGIISKNLINALKKNKMKYKIIGRKNIDLLNDKRAHIKISKFIKKDDTVIFISAKAPAKNFNLLLNNIDIVNSFIEGTESKKISHLIYISSDAVYSDIKTKIYENSKTLPLNFHGMMHIIRESILGKKFGKKILIIRPTLIYGKHDNHNGYGPNQFLRLAQKNKNIHLFGKGEELRDHVYIETVVSAIIKCILRKGLGKLNLASGEVNSFNQIARKIIKLTKSNSKIKYKKRNGLMPHNGYRPFDISLLKKKFGNIKIHNLKTGLKEYISLKL